MIQQKHPKTLHHPYFSGQPRDFILGQAEFVTVHHVTDIRRNVDNLISTPIQHSYFLWVNISQFTWKFLHIRAPWESDSWRSQHTNKQTNKPQHTFKLEDRNATVPVFSHISILLLKLLFRTSTTKPSPSFVVVVRQLPILTLVQKTRGTRA